MEPTRAAGRRLTTITVDQVVSGASNLGVSVLAAHALGLRAFGLWEITFLVFVLVQSVSRALVCEPVLVHPQEAEERPGDVIGTAARLGLGQGVLIGVGRLCRRCCGTPGSAGRCWCWRSACRCS